MLSSLSIRNIVLIDKLDLSLHPGLCIFSGETGAGKSIILDALGLALGRRADSGLVRKDCEQGSVAATFAVTNGHPVEAMLAEQGMNPEDGELILRRVLGFDGRSKAFINDNPVSVSLLSRVANLLIEVHGQHDERGLLHATGHMDLLDAYGGHTRSRESVTGANANYNLAREEIEDCRAELAAAKADEDYYRHCLEELDALDPKSGEEQSLAEMRALMMQGEKLSALIDEVLQSLTADGGVDAKLRAALHRLERVDTGTVEPLRPVIAALSSVSHELEDGLSILEGVRKGIGDESNRLEDVEERLFALRAQARKHRCTVDELTALSEGLREKLSGLDRGEARLAKLIERSKKFERKFVEATKSLSKDRKGAASELDKATGRELKPLKLERARFRTRIVPKPRSDWGANGAESIAFEVSTNLGDDFGPLVKIASGGELARFVLALKVVMAGAGTAPTLIFDEVDRGVGGATASAVGERLARLATEGQVIVVTHSPQVAALAEHHWLISKQETGTKDGRTTVARIMLLDRQGRREELARMLAGVSITDEARAAAARLLEPAVEGSTI
jgi:DNA repair protein RecN (Recombination protein N)